MRHVSRISVFTFALIVLINFIPESADAAPALRIRANTDIGGAVKLRVIQKRRRKGILNIERASNGTSFSLISQIERPKRRVRIFDLPATEGTVFYRAVMRTRRNRIRFSKVIRVERPSPIPDKEVDYGELDRYQAIHELCPDDAVKDLFIALNAYRSEHNLHALTEHPQLTDGALIHADFMADSNELAHTGWYERLLTTGYSGTYAGQNIAKYIQNPYGLVNAFSESPGHNGLMLKEKAFYLGVGCIIDAEGTYWWALNFGN